MEAQLIARRRDEFPDGAVLEIVIWLLPEPSPGSFHRYKYRMFYGYPGRRVVGYDNERGKGDHKHFEEKEVKYIFTDVDTLVNDFFADVDAKRRA